MDYAAFVKTMINCASCSKTILVFAIIYNVNTIFPNSLHFQEDLGHFRNSPGDVRLREVATKNRAHYRRLRKELEDLTDHGLRMLKSLQRPEANIMQRLAVQLLCKQLDQAWTYFNRYVIMHLLLV